MIVMKFGGTSVANRKNIASVAQIVKAAKDRAPLVVVSALGGVTDQLLKIGPLAQSGDLSAAEQVIGQIIERHYAESDVDLEQSRSLGSIFESARESLTRWAKGVALLRELTPRTMDAFASMGELLSSHIVTAALQNAGLNAVQIAPMDLIPTDSNFTAATPDEEGIAAAVREKVLPLLAKGVIPLTGGFVGREKGGEVTTLGRGGSDYTAALLGAAANAESIEIWTDVDGILTADPRVVPEAKLLPEISYAEAAEMAFFGAKVLHPATIRPAVQKNIPVWIKNTFRPSVEGTVVRADTQGEGLRALAARRGYTALFIANPKMLLAHGYAARVFGVFEKHRVPVDVITTSEVSISVTVDEKAPLSQLLVDLSSFAEVQQLSGLGVVTAVGKDLRRTKGIAAKIFAALREVNIVMISLGGSNTNITLVLAEGDIPEAMRRLHAAFFEGATFEGK